MSTVKRITGNYTITANAVIQNTLANVVTGTSNFGLDINSTTHIFIPDPISSSGTANLHDGSAGQVVVLSTMSTNTWTVTVLSAAWTSYGGVPTSGNLVFNNPKESLTLRWTPEVYGWLPIAAVGSPIITT